MLNVVRLWIALSALIVSAGWILSLGHALNIPGYLAVFAAGIVGLGWARKKFQWLSFDGYRWNWKKWRQRFKRPAPFLFLVLVVLSFFSGALYPAYNYDANAYRLPRVFHWLAEQRWHWIYTHDFRMNVAAPGFEWLSAPLMLFGRGDRLIFLINWISYLMLPGLIFSLFRRSKMSSRVCWWWTWLLSSAGWCYALQAGSIANDSFAVIYALAAVELALRAAKNGKISDFWLSCLAMALLTGVKQTNAPLGLVWLGAIWPARRVLRTNLVGTTLVGVVCVLVSLIPITFLNYKYGGAFIPEDAHGIALLGPFKLKPFWGVVGNVFCITVQNLVVPFYYLIPPLYDGWPVGWNQIMLEFLKTPFGSHFSSFENFGFLSAIYYNGISEGNAGIGLGLSVLLLISLRDARRLRRQHHMVSPPRRYDQVFWLRILPWASLLVFMAKVGTFENARHLAPYYPFLFPLLLARPGHDLLVRRRGWQRFGLFLMAFTAFMIVMLTDRPLFPAQTFFTWLSDKYPKSVIASNEFISYVQSNYQAMAARRKYLASVLPDDGKPVAYLANVFDIDEPGIWMPYGRHRVACIMSEDSPEQLRARNIGYLVLDGNMVHWRSGTAAAWAKEYNATLLGSYRFPRRVILNSSMVTPPDFYIAHLN
ncbi:MAG TPA: hypothetical protein VN625_10075 [Desulfuromonadaceae bacterium]|nr:hypothetical protein [Desulfuromonadaceae bacterium]